MKKLSVALATFNEEDNIAACLESVRQLADEVVVVDGFSTDQTRQIAKSFGARVMKTTNKPMFHTNKNMAIDACQGQWILQLDADERVSPVLAAEIKEIVNQPIIETTPAAYWLKRKNYFFGRFLKKGGQYPDPVIRLFQKGKGRLPEKSVHEQLKVDGQVGWLKNDLIHWATPRFSRYLIRWQRYTALDAQAMKKEKIPVNLIIVFKYLFYLPLKTFFSIYVFHKGFVDLWPGFIFAFFSGLHPAVSFLKYLKVKE